MYGDVERRDHRASTRRRTRSRSRPRSHTSRQRDHLITSGIHRHTHTHTTHTHTHGLTPSELAYYEEHGFVILRDAFSRRDAFDFVKTVFEPAPRPQNRLSKRPDGRVAV